MTTPLEKLEDGADALSDLFEKAVTPAGRAGRAVERVGKMDRDDVDHEVIALQLTKNSPKGHSYTEAEIPTLVKLHEDTEAGGVGITAKQARALIRDQRENSAPSVDGLEPA